MQALGAAGRLRLGFEGGRDVGKATRHRQLVDHGPQVQPGPAHEQGPVPAGLDAAEDAVHLGLEPAQRELLVGIDQVHQVVGHLGPLGRPGLGRPDVHPPVDAHGVDRHELGLGPPTGQVQRQGGLPRRRRAHEGDMPGRALGCRSRPHEPYRAETGMRIRWRRRR